MRLCQAVANLPLDAANVLDDTRETEQCFQCLRRALSET